MAIDSVDRQVERDLALIKRLGFAPTRTRWRRMRTPTISPAPARLIEASSALAAAASGCGIAPANDAAAG